MNLRSKKINNECGGDTCSESTFITSDKGPDQDHFFSE